MSSVLFSIAFIPAIGQRLAHRLTSQPEQITLTGHVFVRSDNDPDNTPISVNAARIEIGGFSTTTDATGAYELQFWTPQRQYITIVFRIGSVTTIKTLNLPSTGNQWIRNWVFEKE